MFDDGGMGNPPATKSHAYSQTETENMPIFNIYYLDFSFHTYDLLSSSDWIYYLLCLVYQIFWHQKCRAIDIERSKHRYVAFFTFYSHFLLKSDATHLFLDVKCHGMTAPALYDISYRTISI